MKIEIWSDVACPFCYMGKRQLEMAIEQSNDIQDIQIIWHSFELDPNAKPYSNQNINELLASKYHISVEQADAMNQKMSLSAQELGLNIQYQTIKPTNTLNAHRLIQFAKSVNQADIIEEKLFKAYFEDGQDVNEIEQLKKIASESGLNIEDIQKLFSSDLYTEEVRNDEYEAKQLGIQGVPFFLFEDKYAISGAQGVETFKQALSQIQTLIQE